MLFVFEIWWPPLWNLVLILFSVNGPQVISFVKNKSLVDIFSKQRQQAKHLQMKLIICLVIYPNILLRPTASWYEKNEPDEDQRDGYTKKVERVEVIFNEDSRKVWN